VEEKALAALLPARSLAALPLTIQDVSRMSIVWGQNQAKRRDVIKFIGKFGWQVRAAGGAHFQAVQRNTQGDITRQQMFFNPYNDPISWNGLKDLFDRLGISRTDVERGKPEFTRLDKRISVNYGLISIVSTLFVINNKLDCFK